MERLPEQQEPDVSIFARVQFEATHNWPDCPIEEVAYLRNEHRHVFHIEAHKPVNHDDRDIEFIWFKHRIEEYLAEEYPEKKMGATSVEMLGRKLMGHFALSKVIVLEDNENGAILEMPKEKENE